MVCNRQPHCPSLSQVSEEIISLPLPLYPHRAMSSMEQISLYLLESLEMTLKNLVEIIQIINVNWCVEQPAWFPVWKKELTWAALQEIQPKGPSSPESPRSCFSRLLTAGRAGWKRCPLRDLYISACLPWDYLRSLSAKLKFSVKMGEYFFSFKFIF